MVRPKTEPAQPENISSWPAWYYGPDGQSAIFESEKEVPSGWKDSPASFADKDNKAEEPAGRQPADATEEASIYDAMSMEELRNHLRGKGIAFHPSAKREKLISLLRTGRITDPLTEN
jgi:hypothetical protein